MRAREARRLLFKMTARKGFAPSHVAEVGVYLPEESNIFDFIEAGVRCTLVEPDPSSIEKIREYFGAAKNVTLHAVAVYDTNGELELVHREASTFVAELVSSPAMINDGYTLDKGDTFTVEARTFDRVDDGTIDLLSVDTEGSEWFVIKHMTSRPAVISLETHGAAYVNHYLAEITSWMRQHDYQIWYKDKTDSVFARRDRIDVTFADSLRLAFVNQYLALRRQRKRFNRFFKAPRAGSQESGT